MNQHRKKHIGASYLSIAEFNGLERVQATKTGLKQSCEEKKEMAAEDFRSESLMEARVGLLRTSLFFDGEIERLSSSALKGCFLQDGDNPFFESVLVLLTRAERLCRAAGSALCRQHAVRAMNGEISAKVFFPVTTGTARRYASSIADFVYFCSKSQWASGVTDVDLQDAESILRAAMFEKCITIQQTFMTRLDMLLFACEAFDLLSAQEIFTIFICYKRMRSRQ